MPIVSIISQPADGQLMAAYRPVVYRVAAKRTDGQPVPPVVYCDIYFDGTYYKSMSKTQYDKLNTTDSEFEFDISDSAQEFLRYQLPVNGGSVVLEASNVFKQCACKFRSSGFDSDGFLTVEDTAPVQGTGSQPPVAGTGTASDTCTIINASLQHEDNQDLATHLDDFKTNLNWQESALPLTHRPATYKVCPGDSDYFPYIDTESREPKCIRLNYRLKGQSGFTTVQWCKPCVSVALVGTVTLPNAYVGLPYNYSFDVTGEAPLSVINQGYPTWMNVAITSTSPTNHTLHLTGTPPEGSDEEGVFVGFDIENCGGGSNIPIDEHINIFPPGSCMAPSISLGLPLPNAVVGELYSQLISLNGTGPFSLSSIVKPAWATVAIVGTSAQISGTPSTPATGVAFSFIVGHECSLETVSVSQSIDVTEEVEGVLINVGYGIDGTEACSTGGTLPVYISPDYSDIDVGVIVYTDAALTTPLTTAIYIKALSDTIFLINGSGLVTTNTGTTC